MNRFGKWAGLVWLALLTAAAFGAIIWESYRRERDREREKLRHYHYSQGILEPCYETNCRNSSSPYSSP